MRTLVATAILASLLSAAIAASDGAVAAMPASSIGIASPISTASASGNSAVRIADFAFSPTSITVTAGDSITWTNSGPATHTSTADSGAWNSGPLRPGAAFTQTLATAGTFTYHCMIHPTMTASVTVLAAGAGPTTTQQVGLTVNYGAGWNIVAGPSGTTITGSSGPLYTFGANDSSYQMSSAAATLTGGTGYWAYFATAGSATLPASSGAPASIQLPAGHYVLIGNSTSAPLIISGADALQAYDPVQGYQLVTMLRPGQGAWAYSARGAALTATPAASTALEPAGA